MAKSNIFPYLYGCTTTAVVVQVKQSSHKVLDYFKCPTVWDGSSSVSMSIKVRYKIISDIKYEAFHNLQAEKGE